MSPIMLALFPLSPKAVAATLLVLAAALAAFLFANPGGPSGSHESPGATPEPAASGPGEDDGGKPGPATFIIEPHFDPADPRQMAAASENVFIGEVLSESGVEVERSTIPNDPGLPVTHFEVRVVRPLASSGAHPVDQRDAAVSVTQLGGTHPGTQEEVLAEGHAHESPGHHDHDHEHEHDGHSHDDGNGHDGHAHQIDRMLQAGQRYAFATTYNERYGSHQLVTQPGGARLLDNASEEEAIALLYSRLPVGPRAAETPEDVQAPEGHDHHHGHERGHDHEHEETP